MSELFDPYYTWLGIPPQDQPPNYYRLLGLELFETNAGAIENAANRQMSQLRAFSTGEYSQQSEQLLNLVAQAKACLLDPEQRSAYEEQIKANSGCAAQNATAIPTIRPLSTVAPGKAKTERAPGSAAEAPVSSQAVTSPPVSTAAARLRNSRRSGWLLPACLVSGGALLALLLLVTLNRKHDPPTDDFAFANQPGNIQQNVRPTTPNSSPTANSSPTPAVAPKPGTKAPESKVNTPSPSAAPRARAAKQRKP